MTQPPINRATADATAAILARTRFWAGLVTQEARIGPGIAGARSPAALRNGLRPFPRYAWYVDGSDVGLTTDDEDVDAAVVGGDGGIALSSLGALAVTGLNAEDDDVGRSVPRPSAPPPPGRSTRRLRSTVPPTASPSTT